jgi:hypothetical protein
VIDHYATVNQETTVSIRIKPSVYNSIVNNAPEGYHFSHFKFYKGDPDSGGTYKNPSMASKFKHEFSSDTVSSPDSIAQVDMSESESTSNFSVIQTLNLAKALGDLSDPNDGIPENETIQTKISEDLLEENDGETSFVSVCNHNIPKREYCYNWPNYVVAYYVQDYEEAHDETEVDEEEGEEGEEVPITLDPEPVQITGLTGGGLSSIGSNLGNDQLDLLYIPSNLAKYDANGNYIEDTAYTNFNGLVITSDGIFYEPQVRIESISNSFSTPGQMIFTQYTKFDDTPSVEEGDLVYGVIKGVPKFVGHITGVNYSINKGSQMIKYTATSIRKNFERASWVFNYKDRNVNADTLLNTIIKDAPNFYCRGKSGNVPSINTVEFNFNNATISDGLRFIFDSAGSYAWKLDVHKVFKVYNLKHLTVEDIYLGEEGESLSDHSEYNVVSLDLNYNLSDRITRLVIRGDFKRGADGQIMTDSDGNPKYLLYDTGWKGTAYTQFNIQNDKTLINEKFKYKEGERNDSSKLKAYAEKYLEPFKDAYIGGTVTLEGVDLDFYIGKAVKIHNSNMNYLENQNLVITNIRYNLNTKTTELTLTSNYWFGTNITNYFDRVSKDIDKLGDDITDVKKDLLDEINAQTFGGILQNTFTQDGHTYIIVQGVYFRINDNTEFIGTNESYLGRHLQSYVSVKYVQYANYKKAIKVVKTISES